VCLATSSGSPLTTTSIRGASSRSSRKTRCSPSESEEFDEVVHTQHAEMGAAALQLWGLPDSVRVPVRWHHDPLSAPSHAQTAALIYTANWLSHRYGFGCQPDEERAPLAEDPVCAGLGLTEGWLDKLDQEALSAERHRASPRQLRSQYAPRHLSIAILVPDLHKGQP
jgi:HD-like signal output (HDOD) protein